MKNREIDAMVAEKVFRQVHSEKGFIVIASVDSLKIGPIERNDWNEDDMCEFRWRVIGETTKKDLEAQNADCGLSNKIDPLFRFFYRVEAMD